MFYGKKFEFGKYFAPKLYNNGNRKAIIRRLMVIVYLNGLLNVLNEKLSIGKFDDLLRTI